MCLSIRFTAPITMACIRNENWCSTCMTAVHRYIWPVLWYDMACMLFQTQNTCASTCFLVSLVINRLGTLLISIAGHRNQIWIESIFLSTYFSLPPPCMTVERTYANLPHQPTNFYEVFDCFLIILIGSELLAPLLGPSLHVLEKKLYHRMSFFCSFPLYLLVHL